MTTKYAWAFPLRKKSAKAVAVALLEVIYQFGILESILHDNGKEFHNKLISHIYKFLSIKTLKIPHYSPQMNGLTERINGILATALAKMVHEFFGTEWDIWLKWTLFCYRNTIQSTTGYMLNEISKKMKQKQYLTTM
jgi:hypothetical protein